MDKVTVVSYGKTVSIAAVIITSPTVSVTNSAKTLRDTFGSLATANQLSTPSI